MAQKPIGGTDTNPNKLVDKIMKQCGYVAKMETVSKTKKTKSKTKDQAGKQSGKTTGAAVSDGQIEVTVQNPFEVGKPFVGSIPDRASMQRIIMRYHHTLLPAKIGSRPVFEKYLSPDIIIN